MTSAVVLFVIIDNRTDLPTPEPAIMPTRCPKPIVRSEFIFLIPTSSISVIGLRLNGFIGTPSSGYVVSKFGGGRSSKGLPKPSRTLPNNLGPTSTFWRSCNNVTVFPIWTGNFVSCGMISNDFLWILTTSPVDISPCTDLIEHSEPTTHGNPLVVITDPSKPMTEAQ